MFLRYAAIALLGLISITTDAVAQGGAVPSPPSSAFNWLNLNRSGQSAAANYYGQVRPNFQTQNALQNVQQDYNNLTQSSTNNNDPNSTLRETGHAATFMNYGRYYPKLNASGGGSRPGQGTGQRR